MIVFGLIVGQNKTNPAIPYSVPLYMINFLADVFATTWLTRGPAKVVLNNNLGA
jgi:hypothetical protein